MTGYATSVIACDAEAAIERVLAPDETPDGRPGVSVLALRVQPRRPRKGAGEPRRPVRDDLPDDGLLQRPAVGEKTIAVGGRLRYFGDGWQITQAARRAGVTGGFR